MAQKYGFNNNLRYEDNKQIIMAEQLKIQIPKPCHEDWEAMSPNQQGRFCGNCAKTVVDFTNMKNPEIQQYFRINQGQKVCGRFNDHQLESIRITIPAQVLYSQTQFHKIFLLALLVSMGTTLFSCSNTNGNKQTIDTVEVVDDETTPHVTMGAPIPVRDSTNMPTGSLPAKKFPIPTALTGDVVVVPVNQKPQTQKDSVKMLGKIHIDTIQ